MKNNRIKSLFLMVFFCLFINGFLIGQEESAHEELPLDELEGQSIQKYDKELQKEFVVIEGYANHEFNPHVTALSSDNEILGNVYEGLFSSSPITLEPQYAIAKEYKVSRDKKRWIIKLRENAYFSNGEKITADDVRDSWIQLLATPNAPYASLLDMIRGAEEFRTGVGKEEDVGIYATDNNTVSIYLDYPANYLPRVLCHTAFSILHRNPTVFSGAYVVDDVQPGLTVLKKNQYYWDKDNVAIEKVTFLQSEDMEYNTFLYNTGKVDWIMDYANADKVLDKDAIQVTPQFGISFYFFKTSDKKPKSDKINVWDYKEFRNALLEAMPWEEVRSGYFTPATTFVYPLTGYPTVDGFDFTDPMEAAIKMKAAREKYNIPLDEKIPLVIEVPTGGILEERFIAIKAAMAPLGVDVQLREVAGNTYFATLPNSDGDIFSYTWIGDFADPLTFLELFSGKSSLNESGWVNEEYDRLIAEAALVSSEERYKLLAQAENILLDEGMIIPISYPVSFNVVDVKEVGGWIPNAFDTHLFKYIYKKRQKVKLPNVVMK